MLERCNDHSSPCSPSRATAKRADLKSPVPTSRKLSGGLRFWPLFLICTVWAQSLIAASSATSALGPLQPLHTAPARWVAEGGGLLVYGSGERVHFALPDRPQETISALSLSAPVSGGAVVGRYAYLAQDGLGLRVLDLALPSNPADLGLIPLQGAAFRVTQWSDYLVVSSEGSMSVLALGTRHSHIQDAAGGHCMAQVDPFALGEVCSLGLEGMPVALAAAGTRVFIATAAGQLQIVDLSDRSAPELLAIHDMASPITALTPFLDGVAVGLAAVASGGARDEWTGGPAIVGARGLAAVGRTLFIAMDEGGLFTGREESAAAVTANVSVGNFFFSPSTVNINQGDKVHWAWISGTHTTTSGTCPGGNCTPDGVWDSGTKSSGSFEFTFNAAGNFPYFCEVHGSSMTGRVNVASVGPTPLTATASVTPSTGPAPLLVGFDGEASGGTPPYAYAWTFGDGTSDPSEKDPPHAYAQPGTYIAVLTVTDAASGTAQAAPLSITATLPSSNPPVISLIRKVAPPFTLVVTGSNLQNGIRVFINEAEWTTVTWKNSGKIKLGGGKALKSVVPKGTSTQIRFLNPDGGAATQSFSW